jgi:ketosteroid isomerase-like protein
MPVTASLSLRAASLPAAFVLALVLVAAPSPAAETDDAYAPVKKFVEAMNKGDVRAVAALHAPQASIVDELPPYHWMGNSAVADWARDVDTDFKKREITEPKIVLQKPLHVDITGDRAYVVVPATLNYREKKKSRSQKGSLLTVSLQKYADGWLIAGWAWTRR